MTGISASFDGPFKHQAHSRATWEKKTIPHHSGRSCSLNEPQPQTMDDRQYQLMDEAVQSTSLHPLHTTDMER